MRMEAGKAVEKSHGIIVLGIIGADKHSSLALFASFKPITWYLPDECPLSQATSRFVRTHIKGMEVC
jgi:hypothetical protein